MDIQQTKQRLRGSLEMHRLWETPVWIVIIGIPVLLYVALTKGGFNEYFWGMTAMVVGLMLLPTGGFALIRTIQIFRKPESYIFCRAALRQPHEGPVRYSVYYTALAEDPEDGSKFIANTHAIFLTHGMSGPTIEEYTNRTVTIAYNRETEMVVVIG